MNKCGNHSVRRSNKPANEQPLLAYICMAVNEVCIIRLFILYHVWMLNPIELELKFDERKFCNSIIFILSQYPGKTFNIISDTQCINYCCHTYTCLHTHEQGYKDTYAYTHNSWIHLCVWVCVYVYTCLCVCMLICFYLYKYM